ncbi:MAG: hypothetical protein OES12_04765, partial [Anaerolineae bacterium]|nr:hypothetical protein [Anaerolineae bacterium]
MKRQRQFYWLFALLALLTLIVAACAGVSQPAESGAPAAEPEAVERVAVLLPASQTDQGWNQQ